MAQAQRLANVLAQIDVVVEFAVPEDVVVARPLKRGRHHDGELVIHGRQKI